MKKYTIWMSVAGILLSATLQSGIASETSKQQSNTPSKGSKNTNISKTFNSGSIPKILQPISTFSAEKSMLRLVQAAPNPPVMVMQDNTNVVKPASNPPVMVMPEMYNKNKSEKTLAPTATLYSHGDPTPIEQVLLEYINRARANPKDEGIRIYNTTDPYILSNASRCGVNMKTVRDEFATYPVKPPIAFNKNIITAARLHSDWMVETGIMDHVGRNGSTFSQRMVAAGYTSTGASGENIFKDARDPWFSHLGFQIDWCNPDLGHRQNIMNFSGGAYKEMGIGVTPHSGMIAVTHDFGSQVNSFICGVVYKDNNNNNFYDIGEGLSGVTITASKGNYYAVSSTSGGYAIPIEPGTTGSVTIEAKGGALGTTVVKNAVLAGQNVKVDFTSPLPGQVSLEYPGLSAVLTQKAVTFKWFKSPGNVSGYWFELADNEDFTNPLVSDQTLTDTSINVPNLKNGTMYYWRVKAQTGAGWGDFSFVNDFSIGIVPDKVEITSENITVINKDTYTITWKKGDSTVTRYLVQLATDDYFIEGYMNVNDSFVVNTSYTFTNISYDSSYYYRVAAMNDAMWSEFSEQRQFSRVQLPDQAKPVYPVDKFVTKNPGVRFGWMSDPDPDAYYSLEIAKDSAMVQNIFIDATIIDTFKMVSVLQRGNTYYWRVRVSNINGWGEYSPIRTLEIQNPGEVHEDYIAQMVHLTASPNPASGDVTISFDLPTSQKASLSILNPLGQTIATLVDGFQNSGNQAYIWNASDNAQGVYYYQLRFGNSVLTYPIVLVK